MVVEVEVEVNVVVVWSSAAAGAGWRNWWPSSAAAAAAAAGEGAGIQTVVNDVDGLDYDVGHDVVHDLALREVDGGRGADEGKAGEGQNEA